MLFQRLYVDGQAAIGNRRRSAMDSLAAHGHLSATSLALRSLSGPDRDESQERLRSANAGWRVLVHDISATKRFSLAPIIMSQSMVATSPSAMGCVMENALSSYAGNSKPVKLKASHAGASRVAGPAPSNRMARGQTPGTRIGMWGTCTGGGRNVISSTA
jgi:hypothetical protein